MAIEPRFRHFDAVGSTNDIALELARAGEPEGLIITATTQLSGRGRRGRTWITAPGENVIMSVLLRPPMPLSELPRLSFVASLAVGHWLGAECGIDCALKWPNDVLVNDGKIAGILVELAISESESAAVIGIGVNINQRQFSADLAGLATSVAIETGQTRDVPALTESLASRVLSEYKRFLSLGFQEILADWQTCMWGLGRAVEITTENGALTGIIRGMDPEGALLLENAAGLHTIHAADAIKTIRN